jgi:hypothetical protein
MYRILLTNPGSFGPLFAAERWHGVDVYWIVRPKVLPEELNPQWEEVEQFC